MINVDDNSLFFLSVQVVDKNIIIWSSRE